ncbi:RepB family plasmid replication initiator protein [Paenochrobactrum pullorum]|uniref:RepB family plasmid replication initiator protein n=1 Tax=Paenochrobactrum pullorum TaxID=1324351 RepID=UPI0035BC0CA9
MKIRKINHYGWDFRRVEIKDYFKPLSRGNLLKSIKEGSLSITLPESPRPLELLQGVPCGEDILTCNDMILHEFLISIHYDSDKTMNKKRCGITFKAFTKFFGSNYRIGALKKSLERLTKQTMNYSKKYRNIAMLNSYEITADNNVFFELSDSIKEMMRCMKKYAYIEMYHIKNITSKYMFRLYKIFISELRQNKWTVNQTDNQCFISYDIKKFIKKIGYKDEYRKFKSKILGGINNEGSHYFSSEKFDFTINEINGKGRGKPVLKIYFKFELKPISHRYLRVFRAFKRPVFSGGSDLTEFRVNSDLWLKAERIYRENKDNFDDDHPKNLTQAKDFFGLWMTALQESLSGIEAGDMGHCRRYRGRSLLNEIKMYGADDAAWGLICEELIDPDISLYKERFQALANNAELQRYERMKDAGLIKNKPVRYQNKPIIIEEYLTKEELLEKRNKEEIERNEFKENFKKRYNEIELECKNEALENLDKYENLILNTDTYNKEILKTDVATTIVNMGFSGDKYINIYIYSDFTGYWHLGKFQVGPKDLFRILKYIGKHLEKKPFEWR